MYFKAVFLDFYGTLVHEDDDIIPSICELIKSQTQVECSVREIGAYWWGEFSKMVSESVGGSFKVQRTIGITSLAETINHFKSTCDAEEIIKPQFEHWMKPKLYGDTKPFLQLLRDKSVPAYILSNIDSNDIQQALTHHGLNVKEVITSEDIQSYKPRPEIFTEALGRFKLNQSEVIHIGDSLTSDVDGARQLGIRTIWLNRLNKIKKVNIEPDYICSDLNEVRTILFSEFKGSSIVV